MGCCEARDKLHKENTILTLTETPSIYRDIAELRLPNINTLKSSHALELFNYVQSILNEAPWVQLVSESNFSAEKIEGSPYNKVSIVTKLHLRFGTYVPLNLILDLFLVPKKRLKWDTCIKSFEILDETKYNPVVHSKIKVMFYSAEIVEKVFVCSDNEEAYILSFSTDHEAAPLIKDSVRAEKSFGLINIREVSGKIEILFINQVDPKTKFESLASSVGIIQQKMWVNSLKKNIQKIMQARSFSAEY